MSDLTEARAEIAARAAARLEDVRWMAETGECLSGAAARIGMKPESLETWLYHKGHPDILRKLRDREPRDPNQRPGTDAMRTTRRRAS